MTQWQEPQLRAAVWTSIHKEALSNGSYGMLRRVLAYTLVV